MPPVEKNGPVAAISERIKEVRTRLAMNQEDFAEAIGVTRSHLSDIETFRIEPSLPAILGILGLHLAPEFGRNEHPVGAISADWLMLGPAPTRSTFNVIRRSRRASEG